MSMEDLSSAPAEVIETPAATPETPAPESAPPETVEDDLDAELRSVFQKATREPAIRDDNGRFASKTPETPATEPEGKVDQPPEQEAVKAQEKPAPIDGPASWSAEMKAKFGTLPPDVQQYVAQRDKETHEAISRLGQAVKTYEPVGKLLEQHQDTFRSKGLTYDQGLSQLLDAQRALDRNPVAAIAQLANVYGVDLARFANPENANPQNEALLSQVRELTQELQTLKGTMTQRERYESDKRQNELVSFVEKFAADKADFNDLADDISAHLTALRSQHPKLSQSELLEKAYDAARWSNPAARERLLAAQAEKAKAEELKKVEEAKKQAEAAKKAASANVKGQAKPAADNDDLDNVLRAKYRQINAA